MLQIASNYPDGISLNKHVKMASSVLIIHQSINQFDETPFSLVHDRIQSIANNNGPIVPSMFKYFCACCAWPGPACPAIMQSFCCDPLHAALHKHNINFPYFQQLYSHRDRTTARVHDVPVEPYLVLVCGGRRCEWENRK